MTRLLLLLVLLFSSAAYAEPNMQGPNYTYGTTFSVTLDFKVGDTAPSPLIPAIGTCTAMFDRAGTDTIRIYQTNASTPTGGTQVGTDLVADTTSLVSLTYGQPFLYATGDGATGGSRLIIRCSL